MTYLFVGFNSFCFAGGEGSRERRYRLLLTGSFHLTGCWVFGRRVLFGFPGIRDGIHSGSVCVELHVGPITHQLKILSVQNERHLFILLILESY